MRNTVGLRIVKAPMPQTVIKGSFAAPESVAHLMVQKFVMGVPLYRQEQEWKRQTPFCAWKKKLAVLQFAERRKSEFGCLLYHRNS